MIAARTLRLSLDSANDPTPVTVRIVGNGGADGQLGTLLDNTAYEIGINDNPINPLTLEDGETFEVPKDINLVIDAGAVFKLNQANVDAGSSAQGIDRSGGSIQVLGTTFNNVVFTSWHDDSIGGDSDGVHPGESPGDWGGIVFRGDSDYDFEFSATDTQRNIFVGNNPIYTFTGFPVPATGATLDFIAFADLAAANENLLIQFLDSSNNVIAGAPTFTLFDNVSESGALATTVTAQRTLTRDQLAVVGSTGTIRIRVTPSAAVADLNVIESLRVDLSVGTAVPIFLNTVNHATVLYGAAPWWWILSRETSTPSIWSMPGQL